MCGTTVLDKDGISAAVVVAEMASHLAETGSTVLQQLHNIKKQLSSNLDNVNHNQDDIIIASKKQLSSNLDNVNHNQDDIIIASESICFQIKIIIIILITFILNQWLNNLIYLSHLFSY